MSYIIILTFLVLVYFFVKNILLVSSFEKPLYERIDEINTWYSDILKIDKLTFKDYDIYYCVCSKKNFHDYVEHIKICIRSKSNDFFEIKSKTFLEKLLIKSSLLNVFKSNNEKFDSLLYIASDNRELHTHLLKESVQLSLIDMFTKIPMYKHDCLKIYNQNYQFCMELSYKIHFSFSKKYKLKDIDIEAILERYGDELVDTFESLKLTIPNDKNGFEKCHNRVKIIKSSIKFSLAGSFISIIYSSYNALPNTIDWFSLSIISLLPSVMVAFLVFFYVFKKFKKSSFRLSSSLKYVVASFFSYYVISFHGMSYLNRTLEYNEQKELVVERKIIDKRKSVKGVSYYFQFEYKYSQTITGNELRVPSDLYFIKEPSNSVRIYIKNGYFNIQYIEKIE